MFSIPYDFNLYNSWFGMAFIDGNVPANEELYKEMYYGAESVDMPDKKRAKVKIKIIFFWLILIGRPSRRHVPLISN